MEEMVSSMMMPDIAQNFAALTGSGVVLFFMCLFFLNWYSKRAFTQYGLEEIKMPFGIYLKRSRIEDDANSDSVVIEGLYETVQQLEYRAREKMRNIMQKMAYAAANEQPQWREYILRGRLAVATAISDNHIVYSLTDDRITDYIALKQDQACEAVCEVMPPDAEKFIRDLTARFFIKVIKVQKWLCHEKIDAYEVALERMKMNGSRIRCETKIQKNKKYLDTITDIEGSEIVMAFNEHTAEESVIGGKMVTDNIAHIENVISPELQTVLASPSEVTKATQKNTKKEQKK